MNDRQLRYLLTVAETRNISAAAKQLYISQPSLSAMIQAAEKQLGVRLFDRTTNPLSLTDAGECYMDAARQILAIERDLEKRLQEIEASANVAVNIGCTSASSTLLMSYLLPKFAKVFPNVKVQVMENHVPYLEKYLKTGEADIICTPARYEEDRFERRVLIREEVVLLAPEHFEPEGEALPSDGLFPCMDYEQLNGKPFALMKTGHMTREFQNAMITQTQILPKVILETERWETCVSMVESGMAFTILPYSPLRKELDKHLKIFSFPVPIYREVSLYWRKNSVLPRITKEFIELADREIHSLMEEPDGQ